MIKLITKKTNNKKGFTLIELIVVIAILGILAAIAIPRLTGVQDTARTSTHNANLKSLESAANIAIAQNGSPVAEVTWSNTATGTTPHLRDNFISDWPTDPWNRATPQQYTVTIATTGAVTVSGVTAP